MTHDEYILSQRIYCDLCLERFDFADATHVVKEGRGQYLVLCDEHYAIEQFKDESMQLTNSAINQIKEIAKL